MSIKDIIFKEPVEDQVNKLIDDARKLNEESSKLWNEIFNFDGTSSYKVPILLEEYERLKIIYDDIVRRYNSLLDEELTQKQVLDLKTIILILFTPGMFCFDLYYGAVYIGLLLQIIGNRIFENRNKEHQKKRLEGIDLNPIDINIGNSSRFVSKIDKFSRSQTDEDTCANNYIHMYITGECDDISLIPDDIKARIISILKRDLNSDSDDLISLLDEVKKR